MIQPEHILIAIVVIIVFLFLYKIHSDQQRDIIYITTLRSEYPNLFWNNDTHRYRRRPLYPRIHSYHRDSYQLPNTPAGPAAPVPKPPMPLSTPPVSNVPIASQDTQPTATPSPSDAFTDRYNSF